MKEFKMSEEKLKALQAYLVKLPYEIAQPIIDFLGKELIEIPESEKTE